MENSVNITNQKIFFKKIEIGTSPPFFMTGVHTRIKYQHPGIEKGGEVPILTFFEKVLLICDINTISHQKKFRYPKSKFSPPIAHSYRYLYRTLNGCRILNIDPNQLKFAPNDCKFDADS